VDVSRENLLAAGKGQVARVLAPMNQPELREAVSLLIAVFRDKQAGVCSISGFLHRGDRDPPIRCLYCPLSTPVVPHLQIFGPEIQEPQANAQRAGGPDAAVLFVPICGMGGSVSFHSSAPD
jgi:hypothetical protein